MKQFLITIAGVFIGLALFFIGVPLLIIAWASAAAQPTPVADHSVLVLDLRQGLTDQPAQNPLLALSGKTGSVLGVEETLRAAARDDRVRGLLVRLPEGGMAPASADELRLALKRFRAAGKPILAHGQGLYADEMALSTYEVAASTGDIWLQPASSFQATGLSRQDIFFKGFFDRHGIQPDYQQRYQYKTAVNPFLYDDYTPAHREEELSWMGSVYDVVLADVAADRGLAAPRLKSLIEAGPYDATKAKANGLIDHLGQVKDAENAILARAGAGSKLVDFDDYAAQADRVPTLAGAPDRSGDLGGGRHRHRAGRRRAGAVRGRLLHPLRRCTKGLPGRDRRYRRQGHRLPHLLARRLRHRLRTDPVGRAGGQGGGETGSGQHGDLRGLGRLLDRLAGLGDRFRAHHPDRIDRRLRRQVRVRPGPGQVRREHARGEGGR
jgi:ClpP class serine protease